MTLAPVRFALWLAAFYLFQIGLVLGTGEVRLTGHEVDLIHSIDIVSRMNDGAVPHVDFMTPLGAFAFLPLQLFFGQGFGPGMSFLLAQALVGAVLLPGIWWICTSRLEGWLRLGAGLGMVAIGQALIFGGETPALSVAMYYNRWCWLLTAFVVFAIMLKPRPGWSAPEVDGTLLGLAGAALLMTKMTYVLALLPAVAVFVLSERPWRLVLAGVVAAAAVLGAVTLAYGPGFWGAYAADLVAVNGGPMRRYPGLSLNDLVASPSTILMHLLLLLAIVYWRRSGAAHAGLLFFFLAPGLVYIVFQNWGNDPKWLLLLGVLLLAVPVRTPKPFFGVDGPAVPRLLALFAFVFYLPNAANILTSPVRNAAQDRAEFAPLIPGLQNADILTLADRLHDGTVSTPYPAVTRPPSIDAPEDEGGPAPSFEVAGETFENCELTGGFVGWLYKAGDQIGAVEEAVGRSVLVADLYDFLWMYAPTQPTPGVAPWYYGGDAEDPAADFVMVPLCALSPRARELRLQDLDARGWELEEVVRSDLFILYRRASSDPEPPARGAG